MPRVYPRLTVSVRPDDVDAVVWRCEDMGTIGIIGPDEQNGSLQLEVYFESGSARLYATKLGRWAKAAGIELRITARDEPEQDWGERWRRTFNPVRAGGGFVVTPPWGKPRPRSDERVVVIDPGRAFGTGTHETTRLCLSIMPGVVCPGDRVLDLGCGSGILAIAAVLSGAGSALGLDTDPACAREAARNARLSGVGNRARFRTGTLSTLARPRFDLVCANIDEPSLLSLVPRISRSLLPGGRVVVSGFLRDDVRGVSGSAETSGLKTTAKRTLKEWVALRLERA
jgi:ribosomal protein L11 methyltransferase